MFCSLRFYIDKAESLSNLQNSMDVLSMVSSQLGFSTNWVEYTLLNPDEDFGYYYHKIVRWKEKSALLNNTPDQLVLTGKCGDLSAPIITAWDSIPPADSLYHESSIEIWYPVYALPLIIRVNFRVQDKHRNYVERYKDIIHQLYGLGFHVNNSYIHTYLCKNESCSLDGGQLGLWASYHSHRFIKSYIQHSQKHCLDHNMDIFCSNSILRKCLSTEKLTKLTTIVGQNNISYIDDSVVFSLPRLEKQLGSYRLLNRKVIRELQKLMIG